jgi:hypothetical protein
MKYFLSGAVATACLLGTLVSHAEDCAFKWDIHQEHALFVGTAKPATASTSAAAPTSVTLGALYQIKLWPAESVSYDLPPGKKMLTEGTFAGLVAFHVPATGAYRVALDAPFWIDVVANHQLVGTKDFGGPQNCPGGPRKLVEFNLKADTNYLLQISGASAEQVKVAITPSANSAP